MITINTQLLDDVLEEIKRKPLHWDQGSWLRLLKDDELLKRINGDECEAAFCFAGWACALKGWKPRVMIAWDGERLFDGYVYARNGVRDDPMFRAIKLLGISETDADALFYHANSLEDLENMVAMLKRDGSLDKWDDDEGSYDHV